jgi:peroxiredoxin Q/BCP
MNIQIGDIFPAFTLKDENGNNFVFNENTSSKKRVIYFYPKADTPGCTKEACAFIPN